MSSWRLRNREHWRGAPNILCAATENTFFKVCYSDSNSKKQTKFKDLLVYTHHSRRWSLLAIFHANEGLSSEERIWKNLPTQRQHGATPLRPHIPACTYINKRRFEKNVCILFRYSVMHHWLSTFEMGMRGSNAPKTVVPTSHMKLCYIHKYVFKWSTIFPDASTCCGVDCEWNTPTCLNFLNGYLKGIGPHLAFTIRGHFDHIIQTQTHPDGSFRHGVVTLLLLQQFSLHEIVDY